MRCFVVSKVKLLSKIIEERLCVGIGRRSNVQNSVLGDYLKKKFRKNSSTPVDRYERKNGFVRKD